MIRIIAVTSIHTKGHIIIYILRYVKWFALKLLHAMRCLKQYFIHFDMLKKDTCVEYTHFKFVANTLREHKFVQRESTS